MDSDYLYGDRVSQQPPSMQGGQHLWFSLLLSPEVGQVIIQLASRPSCNKDLLAREILSALIRSDDQLEWVITAPESNQSRHEQVQHSSSITARTALSQGPSHAPSLPMQQNPSRLDERTPYPYGDYERDRGLNHHRPTAFSSRGGGGGRILSFHLPSAAGRAAALASGLDRGVVGLGQHSWNDVPPPAARPGWGADAMAAHQRLSALGHSSKAMVREMTSMELDDGPKHMPCISFPVDSSRKRKAPAGGCNSRGVTATVDHGQTSGNSAAASASASATPTTASTKGGGSLQTKTIPLPGSDLPFRSNRLCRQEGCTNRYRSPGYMCENHGGGRCQAAGCSKLHQGRQGLPDFFFCRHHRKRYGELVGGSS